MNKTATIGLCSMAFAALVGFGVREVTAAAVSKETTPLFASSPYITAAQDKQLSAGVAGVVTGNLLEKLDSAHKLSDVYQGVGQNCLDAAANPSNFQR